MTSQPSVFAAVVLAGGRGSRLGGADKAMLVVGGVPMLTGVLGALAGAGAAPVIVMGPRRPEAVPASARHTVRFLDDQVPAAGPAAALATAIVELGPALPARLALVAADLPHLTAPDLESLRTALSCAPPRTAGAVPIDPNGRPQWLLSIWHAAALRDRVADVGETSGMSLGRLLSPLPTVPWQPPLDPGSPAPWQDCDTPEDLAEARRRRP